MTAELLVNVTPSETRVAYIDGGILQEIHIEREARRGIVGNIYKGRVSRVLPGMQAAFVDIGLDKAAFLHASDIMPHTECVAGEEQKQFTVRDISELVRQGQDLMVQVVKDPLGTKGARLTTDIRVIAAGNGCTDDLQLEHLPANTDIRVGDVLVTSGLGGRFPEGYPVAVVSSVKLDTQRAYTVIQARPTAGLQRLRYLLLLWGADRNGANPMTPEEVHRVANERLMQMMPQVLPSPDAMGPKLPEPATGIAQPTPQQPATGNAATAPAAPTQPAANRSPQRATPPQSGAQPPARAPGGQ